jgi:hypothetical protein
MGESIAPREETSRLAKARGTGEQSRGSMEQEDKTVRDMNDFTAVGREGGWILGCVGAAVLFCYLAPEYGYTPVLVFSIALYGLTGMMRFLIRIVWRRRGGST